MMRKLAASTNPRIPWMRYSPQLKRLSKSVTEKASRERLMASR